MYGRRPVYETQSLIARRLHVRDTLSSHRQRGSWEGAPRKQIQQWWLVILSWCIYILVCMNELPHASVWLLLTSLGGSRAVLNELTRVSSVFRWSKTDRSFFVRLLFFCTTAPSPWGDFPKRLRSQCKYSSKIRFFASTHRCPPSYGQICFNPPRLPEL